jgi:hypothetical protein
MSFDTNGRTMMGVGAADLMGLHQRLGVHACGTNCGIGASEVVATILNLQASKSEGEDPILVAKANCGIPEFIGGEIHYNGTPEIMARYAVMAPRPSMSPPCAMRSILWRRVRHPASKTSRANWAPSAPAPRPRPVASTK